MNESVPHGFLPAPVSKEEAHARVPELDGLRGLAILAVLAFHGFNMMPVGAVDRVVAAMVTLGWCGVDLFFVLSGYLITGILLRAKGKPGYAWNFYGRRFLRIFPPYYLFLAFFFFIWAPTLMRHYPAIEDLMIHQAWNWVFLGNFHQMWHRASPTSEHLNHLWSLAIEEQFYLVWPWIVRALPPERLKRACVAIVIGAFSLRVLSVCGSGWELGAIYLATPMRMDGLAIGSWIAVSHAQGANLSQWKFAASKILGISVAVVSLAVWINGSQILFSPAMATYGLSALQFAFGAALVLSLGGDPCGIWRSILAWSGLRVWGRYSYTIYIWHWPLLLWLASHGWSAVEVGALLGGALIGQMAYYLGCGCLCLGLGWVSWRIYEEPILRLRRFFDGPLRAEHPLHGTKRENL